MYLSVMSGQWGMGGKSLYLPRMYKTIVNNGINCVYIKYTGFLRSYGRRFWEIRFFSEKHTFEVVC